MLLASLHNPPTCLHLPNKVVELDGIRAKVLLPRYTKLSQRPNSQGRHTSLQLIASQRVISTLPAAERQQGQDAELEALCAFAGALLPPSSLSNGRDSGFLQLDGSEQRGLLDKACPDHPATANINRSSTERVLAQARQAKLLRLPRNDRQLVQR